MTGMPMHRTPRVSSLFFTAALLGGVACSGTDKDSGIQDTASDSETTNTDGLTPRTISFQAQAGGAEMACGTSFSVGSTEFIPRDLRFFVTGAWATTEDGETVSLTIVDDSPWQGEGVALVDLEDGCGNGTPDVRTTVAVEGPAGRYAAVGFTLGVPFEVNHADAATATAPLNTSAMFWSWNAGYKFLRLDGDTTDAAGIAVHLGSTACEADESGTVTGCANENRVEVVLGAFDPDTDTISLDLDALLSGSDLSANQADTPALCMSGPTDTDCAPIFAALGLPFGDTASATQTVFSVK